MKRQLAAILYADVAGYSRLTGIDEQATHQQLNTGLNLLTDKITAHGGHKVHEAGDAILAEFTSVTEAVNCAVGFQHEMTRCSIGLSEDQRLEFRVGVNLGEVMHDRGDIYGDDVNLAARIQELADPGGVCISGTVYEQVQGKLEHAFDDLGHQKLKNIAQSVRVYAFKNTQSPSKSGRGMFFDNITAPLPVTTGGCLCGEIRFQVTGKDIGSAYCHCRMCQRFAGAPVSAGTGFLSNDIKVIQGEPKIFVSSVIAERAFCPTCGSSLWMRYPAREWTFVKTLCLDNPEDFAPTTHFCVESQMPWLDVRDDLPRLSCEDSPALVADWEISGVHASDSPRNVNLSKLKR